MSVELDEVYTFIARHEPFSHLPAETLQTLPAKMGITYVRRGETIFSPGEVNDTLYIIRSGAVDVVGEDNMLLDRRDAGLNFGYSTLVGEPESRYLMQAVEDSVLLMLPRDAFAELLAEHPDLERFFQTASRRVSAAAAEVRDTGSADMLRTPLSELIAGRDLITRAGTVTIADAAAAMDEHKVTCLVIHGGEHPGILTDRDLRSRVVARRVDPDRPVSEVMTSPVRTIPADALVFEAMLVMSELGIHHLPVEGPDGIAGVVTSSDIMRLMHTDPIYLAADVDTSTLEELEGAYGRAAEVAVRFFERGASAAETQRLLTSIADSVARRLYQLAVDKLGPPPVPFAFVAVGSQARGEMGPASDQDNALVLSNEYDEAAHGAYFAELAEFICQGLARAGQALCPGDMMASNPDWRMTEAQWDQTFHGWVTNPEPNALLHAQVFFDFRAIFGAGDGWRDMVDRVHNAALVSAQGSRRLHTHLAALATFREPPIGFFRGLVVERSGEYASTLDIKKGGTAAVVQMARLYAITAGSGEVDTIARLRASAGSTVSEKGAHDLLDAYEYLANLTMRHQVAQVRAGERPNYHIDPKQLPERDRAALRDAFGVIKSLQNALANKYPTRAV
ncbi:cyclic nucleotide-binding/CBS domain-containing protein [Corynebacterium sp. CNCTC7651]|uniref:DUF294 nucleotidyltransferase-like domain-containing protein n=1 Tax=Corynebacterium sp. CNCTC7651 TaxID=2815361 RepID=UPI001F2898F0|nr:DUF294 nucleotidyltransferase-like domain-containing protein [Corynebacterium sp. CNCTC7651]UIZ93020.1 cyclic nucleotide-binding/CBS domain-containing protein [Corynebacterium sp. CNCTC7651]